MNAAPVLHTPSVVACSPTHPALCDLNASPRFPPIAPRCGRFGHLAHNTPGCNRRLCRFAARTMLASSSASCRALLPRSAAARPRCSRRPCGRVVLVRATATFEELRGTAAEAVAAAQAKLPALEQAKRSAAQHKEPAAEAERHWQDSHARLSSLQAEVQSAMKQLRESVVAAAGGEDAAAHALLRRHTQERLQHYRDNYSLGAGSEWKVGAGRGGASKGGLQQRRRGAVHCRRLPPGIPWPTRRWPQQVLPPTFRVGCLPLPAHKPPCCRSLRRATCR